MLIVTPALRKHAEAKWGVKAAMSDGDVRRHLLKMVNEKKLTLGEIQKALKGAPESTVPPIVPEPKPGKATIPTTAPEDDRIPESEVYMKRVSKARVKECAERFDASTKTAIYPKTLKGTDTPHPMAERPVNVGGGFNEPSDRDKAIATVTVKASLQGKLAPGDTPRWLKMTESDEELLQWAMRNEKWSGPLKADANGDGGIAVKNRKLNDFEIKTLIADTVSGGLFAVPAAFDDAIILYPILYGEIFPHLDIIDVRSNRVQGATMQRPTFTSGVVEGTGVQPFDTSAFIGAFDTPVYNAQGGMEIGKDFEEDSPVVIGETIQRLFGEAAMVWLDRVAAYGNGVTEPQGMLRASGLNVVNSAFGAGGPMTVNDYQALWGAVNIAYRREPGAYMSYISNDNSYRNGRNIPIGTDDQRRVLGMDWNKYALGEENYAVQNDIPDGTIGYFNLKRYRMYRRLGVQITVDDSGYQLRTRNTRLIVARMRFGGRLTLGGAGSIMSDAQP